MIMFDMHTSRAARGGAGPADGDAPPACNVVCCAGAAAGPRSAVAMEAIEVGVSVGAEAGVANASTRHSKAKEMAKRIKLPRMLRGVSAPFMVIFLQARARARDWGGVAVIVLGGWNPVGPVGIRPTRAVTLARRASS